MEEKVLIKGIFSKLNFLSIILWGVSIYFFIGFFMSLGDFEEEPALVLVGLAGIVVFFGGGFLLQYLMNNCALTVSDKRVFGKAAFGQRVDLPFDKVSSVAMCAFKGIAVATSSGKIKFLFCKNKDEVFDTISEVLLERQNKWNEVVAKQDMSQSNADEIKKFKELLDSGIITQEEFDAKKKQLLGL